jgi:hypothetical protein
LRSSGYGLCRKPRIFKIGDQAQARATGRGLEHSPKGASRCLCKGCDKFAPFRFQVSARKENKVKIRSLLIAMLSGAALIVGLHYLHAQEAVQSDSSSLTGENASGLSDLEVELRALELTTPLPATVLVNNSASVAFYSAQHSPASLEPWPPLPADVLNLDVWSLGDGLFVLDDRNVNYTELATPQTTSSSSGGVEAMDDGPPGPPGGGGTNGSGGGGIHFNGLVFTTNDLWLQMDGVTNTGMGLMAYLTIHTPWNDTNLTHDLLYTTSLDSPVDWRFLMRCTSTNVIVSGLCEAQGFFALNQTNGNLTVSTNSTALQLAQLLVPPWVFVTNATYTGTNLARGTFAGGNGCGLPIDSGVILSSGSISNAIGPNNQSDATTAFNIPNIYNGDPDLDNLVGGSGTEDAAVLEFDIISTNSFTLQFQYVFASEEYPEFIGQPPDGYNDPMAIFVSTNRVGTNWINSITNDLALVPGTTNVPVSVNTINGGCVNDFYNDCDSPTNAQYYVDNHDPHPYLAATNAAPAPEFNIQYDGMTVLLMAQTFISANVTNHVKIAIADYGDDIYDSAVFITAAPMPCN